MKTTVLCFVSLQELPEYDKPVQQHNVSCQRWQLFPAPSLQQPWKTSTAGTLWFAHRTYGGGKYYFGGVLPVCWGSCVTERRKHNRVLSRGTEKQKKMNFLYMIKCFHILASQGLMHSSGPVGRHRQLVMVLEGELYLIPFALLKGSSSNEYLYERFSLIAVPSIHGLGTSAKVQLLI